MISEKEIEELINDFKPKKGKFTFEKIIKNEYLYFVFFPEDVDDRYAQAGGGDERGIPIINLNSGEVEYIHYMDIPPELFNKKSIPTNDLIISKIKKRKYINLSDVFNFYENEFQNEDTICIDYYKIDKKRIGLKFVENKVKKKYETFFEDIGVSFVINDDLTVEISRELPPAGPRIG